MNIKFPPYLKNFIGKSPLLPSFRLVGPASLSIRLINSEVDCLGVSAGRPHLMSTRRQFIRLVDHAWIPVSR